jgi:thioester reductase-like protein
MPAKSFSAEFESVARGPTKGYSVTKLAKENRPAGRRGVSSFVARCRLIGCASDHPASAPTVKGG